jgi:hypothetical protein
VRVGENDLAVDFAGHLVYLTREPVDGVSVSVEQPEDDVLVEGQGIEVLGPLMSARSAAGEDFAAILIEWRSSSSSDMAIAYTANDQV